MVVGVEVEHADKIRTSAAAKHHSEVAKPALLLMPGNVALCISFSTFSSYEINNIETGVISPSHTPQFWETLLGIAKLASYTYFATLQKGQSSSTRKLISVKAHPMSLVKHV